MINSNRKYNPELHHRRSIRLKGYDYSRTGVYFVTICLQDKDSRLLGEIKDGKTLLSRFGEIVWKCWNQLPKHYANVKLDVFMIMPNHVHGVVWLVGPDGGAGAGLQNSNIKDVKPARTVHDDNIMDIGAGFQNSSIKDVKPARTDSAISMAAIFPAGNPMSNGVKKYPLPEIIRGFKTFSARRINELQGISGVPVWQRNYYEYIVRNDEELRRIREYIINNPTQWNRISRIRKK